MSELKESYVSFYRQWGASCAKLKMTMERMTALLLEYNASVNEWDSFWEGYYARRYKQM